MIVCPNCNHQNPEGASQCEACYAPLPMTTNCPNCGATVQTDATFCGQCGFNLKVEISNIPEAVPNSIPETAMSIPEAVSNPIPETAMSIPEAVSNPIPETAMSIPQAVPNPIPETAMSVPQAVSNPIPEITTSVPQAEETEKSTKPDLPTVANLPSTEVEPINEPIPSSEPQTINQPVAIPKVSSGTQLQIQTASLLHVQTNTMMELPQNVSVIHIGRPNDQIPPDIDVSSYPDADVVSRVHADIRVEGDVYYLEDMASANGTYVNGQRLLQGNRHRLRGGDRIALGKQDKVSFIFSLSN